MLKNQYARLGFNVSKKIIKSQISSTKLFTLLNNSNNGVTMFIMKILCRSIPKIPIRRFNRARKFQISMTKTFTIVVSHRVAPPMEVHDVVGHNCGRIFCFEFLIWVIVIFL
jgi:hypothetical protein